MAIEDTNKSDWERFPFFTWRNLGASQRWADYLKTALPRVEPETTVIFNPRRKSAERA